VTAPAGGVVFLFPGQGSQYVGMGRSFFEAYASVRRLFEEAADVTGMDLRRLCFEGPAEELVETANVQPAITLVNLACAEVLREEGVTMAATAGHSLGEYAALCAAGVFSFADAMRLVQQRGRAMQAAAERNPGGMAAVFGLDLETLTAICAEVGSVEVANQNSPNQVAITGDKDALKRASELAKARGAKLVVPLKVSGAWHSRYMAEAKEPLRAALDATAVQAARVPVMANVTAAPHGGDAAALRAALVDQIVSTVLWSKSMAALIAAGHQVFVEVGPGKVLSGLMKDISRDVKAYSVQDAETLAKFRAAVGPAAS
jgi:[acyl-carrier-protein] S-malonyltransferase